MNIRNVIGLILAVILCSLLAAQENQIPRSELAMRGWPLVNSVSNEPSAAEQRDARKSAEQSEVRAYPVKAALRDAGRSLNIFVLLGDRAVNSIRTRSATAPVVEVRDERNLPIQGAEVVFHLPAVGPGGFFAGQQLTWTGTTDGNGQVAAVGFAPNQQPGRFNIRVTASHGGRVAHAIIAQSNSIRSVSPEGRIVAKRSGWWKVAAVVGAGGAVGGVIWATRGGAERPTVVLQPGTISFGGPR